MLILKQNLESTSIFWCEDHVLLGGPPPHPAPPPPLPDMWAAKWRAASASALPEMAKNHLRNARMTFFNYYYYVIGWAGRQSYPILPSLTDPAISLLIYYAP